jgi:hypothetical protein
MGSILTDFHAFLTHPFRANMDLFSVFLAVGLVLVIIMLWSRILAHLSGVEV